MASAEYVSTAGAARKAGVAVSSVKRWADDGVLPCSRTAGGHRRFLVRDLEQFLATQAARAREGHSDRFEEWLAAMRAADEHTLLGTLYLARGRLGAWHRVADEVGAALTYLGEQWAQGVVRVSDEHVASERLHRALAQVAAGLTSKPELEALTTVLATAEGDEHTLGLSLADLCLREAGVRTLWVGRRTPFSELLTLVKEGDAKLIALSASVGSTDGARLSDMLEPLARACRARGVSILLGGAGAWPDNLPGTTRIKRFAELQPALAALQMGAE